MSSKYHNFLLSTCLPVMAIAIYTATPVYAGFEWTPPKKAEEALPLPVEEFFEPIVSSPISDVDQTNLENMIDEEPAIQIKVMDAVKEEPIIEVILEEEIIIDDEVTLIELEASEIEEDTAQAPEIVIIEPETFEADIQETNTDAINDNTASPEPTPLKINPFPMEDKEVKKPISSENTVVLPSDSDKDISDFTAEEVNIKDVVEAPKDDIIWNKKESFYVIEGFGTDMPLALALRQIVPPQYAFSFGKGINPGEAISWNGGKPWNTVLEEALAPLNIKYELKDKKLLLSKLPSDEKVNDNIQNDEIPEELIEEIEEDNSSEEILEEDVNEASVNIQHKQEEEIFTSEENITSEIEEIEPTEIPSSDVIEPEKEVITEKIVEIIEEEAIIEEIENTKYSTEIIEESDEVSMEKRSPILDPGQFESTQPEISKDKEIIIDNIEPVNISGNLKEEEIIEVVETEIDEIKTEPVIEIVPEMDKIGYFITEPSNEIKIWEAKRGSDLKKILKEWGEEEKIRLILNMSKNYKINKDVYISGTFKNAIDILFSKGVKDAPKYVLLENNPYELGVF